MKKKILVIGAIILLIVFVLLIRVGKNYFIISELKDKYEETTEVSNYHIKQIEYQYSNYIISDMYTNDNKSKLIVNMMSLEDYSIKKMVMLIDNDTTKIYTYDNGNIVENSESKVQPIIMKNPYNLYSKESESNILVELYNTSIKSTTYHGEECYIINNTTENNMYISKETGLVLKENNGYVTTEEGKKIEIEYMYYYEFNNVTDNDIAEVNEGDFN